MSKYISGSGSAAYGRKETTFGSGGAGGAGTDVLLNMTSESMSSTYNRMDEGTLLASKTRPAQDLGSITVSGGISTVLKPDFIDWLLEVTLGVVDDTVTGQKTYTLADPDEDLPSSSIVLEKGSQNFRYNGLTVSSLTLDCTAGDFVKADINFSGYNEEYLTTTPTKPTASGIGSYKCTKAKLFNAAAGADDISDFSGFSWDTCPAGTVYDVQRTQLTIDNALEESPQTYCSGLLANQPVHGQRAVTLSCEVPYSSAFETFRQTYYAKDDTPNLALMLCFCTKETVGNEPKHQVYIIIPNLSIDGADANVSGQGRINGTYSGTALSVGNVEPIKIIVRTLSE